MRVDPSDHPKYPVLQTLYPSHNPESPPITTLDHPSSSSSNNNNENDEDDISDMFPFLDNENHDLDLDEEEEEEEEKEKIMNSSNLSILPLADSSQCFFCKTPLSSILISHQPKFSSMNKHSKGHLVPVCGRWGEWAVDKEALLKAANESQSLLEVPPLPSSSSSNETSSTNLHLSPHKPCTSFSHLMLQLTGVVEELQEKEIKIQELENEIKQLKKK